MKVILTSRVAGLGETGDMVDVKNGFARNYLIPRGKAMVATLGNVKSLGHQKRVVAARVDKERKAATDVAEQLAVVSLTISRHAGEEDRLFGSVTVRDIGDALQEQGIKVDMHSIELAEPIKVLGVYNVPIRLHTDVAVEIKVWVVGL